MAAAHADSKAPDAEAAEGKLAPLANPRFAKKPQFDTGKRKAVSARRVDEAFQRAMDMVKEQGESSEDARKAVEAVLDLADQLAPSDTLYLYYTTASDVVFKGTKDVVAAMRPVYRGLKAHPKDQIIFEYLISFLRQHNVMSEERMKDRASQFPLPHPVAYNNLAAPFVSTHPDIAEMIVDLGIAMDSTIGELHLNLGDALWAQRRMSEAIASYYDAYNRGLSGSAAYLHLGENLYHAYRYTMTAKTLEKALQSQPADNHFQASLQLASVSMLLGIWDKYESSMPDLMRALSAKVRKSSDVAVPLSMIQATMFPMSPQLQLALARASIDGLVPQVPPLEVKPSWRAPLPPKRRLRIGFISADFRVHPVSKLLHQFFKYADKSRYEIVCFNILVPQKGEELQKDRDDHITAFIKRHADQWVDLWQHREDHDAAKDILKHGIDVLIDLQAHSVYGRLGIMSLRAAPVQVSFLGFCGSTGADYVDWIVTDKVASPHYFHSHYSEKLAYMPGHFEPSSHRALHPRFADPEYRGGERTRKEFGIPEDAVVFINFNRIEKVTPRNMDAFVSIVKQVPNSYLWMLVSSYGEDAVPNVLKYVREKHGMPKDRIIFTNYIHGKDHLEVESLADVSLDTWIYNGGSTNLDILWSGVPMITLPGTRMTQRLGASMLNALNLNPLVAKNPNDYVAKAVKLGKSKTEREKVRRKLAEAKSRKNGVFDIENWSAEFLWNLEKMYEVKTATVKKMHLI